MKPSLKAENEWCGEFKVVAVVGEITAIAPGGGAGNNDANACASRLERAMGVKVGVRARGLWHLRESRRQAQRHQWCMRACVAKKMGVRV